MKKLNIGTIIHGTLIPCDIYQAAIDTLADYDHNGAQRISYELTGYDEICIDCATYVSGEFGGNGLDNVDYRGWHCSFDRSDEFSSLGCACCGSTLAGERYYATHQDTIDAWRALNDHECDERYHEAIYQLIDALQDYAPDGCYVGMHPGDGSDFGVWLDPDSDS